MFIVQLQWITFPQVHIELYQVCNWYKIRVRDNILLRRYVKLNEFVLGLEYYAGSCLGDLIFRLLNTLNNMVLTFLVSVLFNLSVFCLIVFVEKCFELFPFKYQS